MKIRYELDRRTNQDGLCRLRICFTNRNKRTYQPTIFRLRPDQWDQKAQKVNTRNPYHAEINKRLKLKMAELTLQADKEPEYIQEPSLTFRQYAVECLGRWEKTKSEGTIRAYQSMLRKVKEYDAEVLLKDITADWLLAYETWCRNDGCDNPGTLKRIAFVSTIIHEALRYGKITYNPFAVYSKPPKENPPKVWLTLDEVKAIETMQTDSDVLKHTAVWFLMSVYTGLRYSDIAKLDFTSQVQEGRLILYTTKTREVVSIKINEKIQRLIDTWPTVPVYSNQKCNQYLKALAHVCRIGKTLTFHTGRHTFATQCANLGISIEVASKLLGHSDLKTTSIYYKIINDRVDAEMQKWDSI